MCAKLCAFGQRCNSESAISPDFPEFEIDAHCRKKPLAMHSLEGKDRSATAGDSGRDWCVEHALEPYSCGERPVLGLLCARDRSSRTKRGARRLRNAETQGQPSRSQQQQTDPRDVSERAGSGGRGRSGGGSVVLHREPVLRLEGVSHQLRRRVRYAVGEHVRSVDDSVPASLGPSQLQLGQSCVFRDSLAAPLLDAVRYVLVRRAHHDLVRVVEVRFWRQKLAKNARKAPASYLPEREILRPLSHWCGFRDTILDGEHWTYPSVRFQASAYCTHASVLPELCSGSFGYWASYSSTRFVQ